MTTLSSSDWGLAGPSEEGLDPSEVRREFCRYLVHRSRMFVPANVPRFIERAYTRGADAIILDLEDSVPPGEKAAARRGLREAMAAVSRGGADVLVRINKPFEMAVEDLDAAVWPGLWGLLFPKVESAEEVRALDRLLTERELKRGLPVGTVKVSLACESARGIVNAPEIAQASLRNVSIACGTEDMAMELMVTPSKEAHELTWAVGLIIQAATAAGIQPFGLARGGLDYSDPEAMVNNAKLSRQMGFRGSTCIHPSQVEVLNTYFRPSPPETEQARRIIAAVEEAVAQGRASASLGDRMIDIPSAERARRILEWARAVEEREARKREAMARAGGKP